MAKMDAWMEIRKWCYTGWDYVNYVSIKPE